MDFQNSYSSETFRTELVWGRKQKVREQDKRDCDDALDLLSGVIGTLGKVRILLVVNQASNLRIWTDVCYLQKRAEEIQTDLLTGLRSCGEVPLRRSHL